MAQTFERLFEGEPLIWARAPGRVDLMGSHTDYNLGYVLTLPIGRDVWIAARPREDKVVSVYSLNLDAISSFTLDCIQPDASQPWSNYLRAVAATLQAEGFALCGFDAVIHGSVPMGSGLSSSAALECACSIVFETLSGFTLAPVQRALLCQTAENKFVGVNCGILDQYTSCMGVEGSAVLLDCRDLSSRSVALPRDLRVVICDTRAKRELAGSEYGERRARCERGARLLGLQSLREIGLEEFYVREHELPPDVAKCCRFIVEENARVGALCEAFVANDRAAIKTITAASFQGASDLYEIATPPMHAMMATMRAGPGVIGARQAGAGFGGCMVAFVDAALVPEFVTSVSANYEKASGLRPEIYAVAAAPCAGLLSLAQDSQKAETSISV